MNFFMTAIEATKETKKPTDSLKDKVPDFLSKEGLAKKVPDFSNENNLTCKEDDNGVVYKIDGKLKPNCEYQINGYSYKTDECGRITEASGNLKLSGESRKSLNEQSIGGADKLDTDVRGHLIADRFGGSNKKENLVAQDGNLNGGQYKKIENECAKALQQGKDVSMSVEVEYDGDSQRPSSFTVTYTINGETYEKTFLNEKKLG